MSAPRRHVSRITPDANALRALAHPQRMRMLGLLRLDGPATATMLAGRLGLNSGATSYHLRQLERHGFIEDDTERGNGRERWWRARHESTGFSNGGDDDAVDAGIAFAQAALTQQVEAMQEALDRRIELSPEWRDASAVSDFHIPMTAAQAKALVDKLHAVLWEAVEQAPSVDAPRAEGVETVSFILHAFPRKPPGTPS